MKPVLLLFLIAAAVLPAAEFTTGAVLGRAFDPRAFYTRNAPRDAWEKTYSSPAYRREARGRLMNVRPARAIGSDAATEAVIEALEGYKRHGVLLISVSLQEDGPAGAFRADGSLDAAWLARLERLLNAAGRRGMAVNLIYFDRRGDEVFDSTKAIHAAARRVTEWIAGRNLRNVLVDVADEFDSPGGNWDFDGYIPQNIIPLIDEVRSRFRAARHLTAVSASSDLRTRYSESLAGLADVISLHADGRAPAQKLARLAELKDAARPVLMTADDGDLAACDAFFHQGSGWGYAATDGDLREVLDHIARLVLRNPPE